MQIVTCKAMTTVQTINNRADNRQSQRLAKLKELQASAQADTIAPHLISPNRTQSPPTARQCILLTI
jgi:hypothetical protein